MTPREIVYNIVYNQSAQQIEIADPYTSLTNGYERLNKFITDKINRMKFGEVRKEKDHDEIELDGPCNIFYGTGQLKWKGSYQNNMKDGDWEGYSIQGKLVYKLTFKEDKRHGSWMRYDENGELMSKGNFNEGRRHGVWEYFGNNARLLKESYDNGRLQPKTESN